MRLPESFYRDPEGYESFLGQEQERLESQVRLLRARGGNPKPVQQRLSVVYSQLDAIRAKKSTGIGDPKKEYQAGTREAELRSRKDQVEAALKMGHPDEKRLRRELSNIYSNLQKFNSYKVDAGARDRFVPPKSDPNSPKVSPSDAKFNKTRTSSRQPESENFLDRATMGTVEFFKETLIPGAQQEFERTREDVNFASKTVAEGVARKYPDGFLKLDWLKKLGEHDDQALVTYYALKNFDPTQIPKMVQGLTEKGVPQELAKKASDAAAKGDPSILMELIGGRDLLQKIQDGDRDAFAQVAGNLTSFVIEAGVGGGLVGSGKSVGRMIRKANVPEPVSVRPTVKDVSAEQWVKNKTVRQKTGSEAKAQFASDLKRIQSAKILKRPEAKELRDVWDLVAQNWAGKNGATVEDFWAEFGPKFEIDGQLPQRDGILNQVEGILSGDVAAPTFAGRDVLTQAATWLENFTKKKPVFRKPLDEVSDTEFVKKLTEHTLKEIQAWRRVRPEYNSFYGSDIVEGANPRLQEFAVEQYGRPLSDAEVKLYHLVSSFASPGAAPVFDSRKGLLVLDKYIREGVLDPTGPEGNLVAPKYAKQSLDKVRAVVGRLGSMEAAMEWLSSWQYPEQISEMLGVDYKKLAKHENLTQDGGFGIFAVTGPKLGSYVLNRWGNFATITKDMWYARSMARLTGDPLVVDGKVVSEPWNLTKAQLKKRTLADRAWQRVADATDTSPAEVQQMMWDAEQTLYGILGVKRDATYISEGLEKGIADLRATGRGAKGDVPGQAGTDSRGIRGEDRGGNQTGRAGEPSLQQEALSNELHSGNAEVGREASSGAPGTGGQLGSPGSDGPRGSSSGGDGPSVDPGEPETLFDAANDRVKGAVHFTPEERPVVHLFTGRSDISTVLHESAHIWRRTLGEIELAVIEKHFGDPTSRSAEEAFARAFERYLRDGLSPDGDLDRLFAKFSGYLARIYAKVKGTPIEDQVPDGIRRVFDQMLGVDSDLDSDPLGIGGGEIRRTGIEVVDEAESNPLGLPRLETLGQPSEPTPTPHSAKWDNPVFDEAVEAIREGADLSDVEQILRAGIREKHIDSELPEMVRDAYEAAGQPKAVGGDGSVVQIGGVTIPAEVVEGLQNWRTVLMPFWRSGIRIVQGLDSTNTKLRDWLIQDRADAVTEYTKRLAEIKKQLKEIEPVVVRKPKFGKAMADLAEGRITREQAVSELGEAMVQRLENATAQYREMYENILEQLNDVRAQYMDEPEAILPRDDMFTHLQEIAKKHEAALGRSVGRTGGVAGDVAEGARSQLGKVDPDAPVTFEAALEPLLSQIHLAEPAIRHRLLAEVLRQAGGELDAQVSTRPKGALQVIDAKRTQAKADSHRRVAAALDEMADILEGRGATLDKAAEKLDFPWLQQTVSYLVQATGRAKIVGNLGSAVMQTLSPALSFPELGFSNVAVGFLKNAAGVMKKADAPMEKSGFLTRRYTDTNTIRPTWSGKAANVLSIPMNLFEETAVRGVWRAAYERGRAGNFIQGGKRMDESEAIRYADRITEQVVGGRAKGEKPTIFESRVGKTMLQFQIEPNNLVGYFGKSFAYDDGRKLSKPELALKVAKTLAGFYALNEMTSFLMGREPLPDPVRQAVGGLTDRDEDEGLWQGPAADIVKSKADQKALRVLGQVFLGDVVGAHPLAAPIVGLGREYDVFGTGLNRKELLGDTELGTFAGGGAPWTSTIRGGTGDPLGSIVFDFTLGGSQIKKTIRAIDGMNKDKISRNFDPKRGWWSGQVSKALASGSRDSKARGGKKRYDVSSDPSDADFWRAITFGPSATKAAGKYYEKQRRNELSGESRSR